MTAKNKLTFGQVSPCVAAYAVIGAGLAFGFLVQLGWALDHNFSDLWWRALLTGLAATGLFAGLFQLITRLPPASRGDALVIVCFVAFSPLVRVWGSPVERLFVACLLGYALILGLGWRRARHRIRLHALAMMAVTLAAGVLINTVALPANTLTVTVESVTAENRYWLFPIREAQVRYAFAQRRSVMESADPVSVTFDVDPADSAAGVQFGGRPDAVTVTTLSLGTRLLLWQLPVAAAGGRFLGDYVASPTPGGSYITRGQHGFVVTPVSPPYSGWVVVALGKLRQLVDARSQRGAKMRFVGAVMVATGLPLLVVFLAGPRGERKTAVVAALAVVAGVVAHGTPGWIALLVFVIAAAAVLVEVRGRSALHTPMSQLCVGASCGRPAVAPLPVGLLFVVALSLVVLRAPELLLDPRFWAEDGRHFFQFGYENSWLDTLLFHPEYRLVVSNVAALIATRLVSVEVAPLVFTLAGLLV